MLSQQVLDKIQARNKDSKMVSLADSSVLSRVTEFVPSGCLPLDMIMGGGYPVGRITEVFGDTSTGKSLLAYHALAQTQQAGGIAVLLDTETTAESTVIDAVGIDRSNIVYCNPDTIEDVFDKIMETLDACSEVASDSLVTIAWDSIAATSSDAEMEVVKKEGLKKAAAMATHARLLSEMFRVMPRFIAKKRICFIVVNQTRAKIGVMYGEKETTFGGKAVGYYSSVRVQLDALSNPMAAEYKQLKTDQVANGIDVRAFIYKNKIAPPFGICQFPIIFNHGIDECGAILWWLKNHEKVIIMKGSWSSLVLDTSEELKFQASSWPSIYAEHESDIKSMIYRLAGYEVA